MKHNISFKQKLAKVFDDNMHTVMWQNVVDWAIIGLILLSTIEIILSTIPEVSNKYGIALKVVDIFTTIVFSIEIALRIWAADLQNPKYKGFIGRIRYCFSFYGFIDIISTYSFYLGFFLPLPTPALKALRIARLLRIFRYMKSFNLLKRAFRSKKDEMFISLQFLIIITLLLSFVLFFMENAKQPEVYKNIGDSVIWAFAQYIGDPGHFANFEPITTTGRVISCIIGILGIAIFAVPAGLIGSGFIETVEEDQKKEEIKKNTEKVKLAFERKLCRLTGYQVVPIHLSIADIMARMSMRENDIIDVVENSDCFRMINLASTIPADQKPEDKLAIEHFVTNTSYGCCIDRGSRITIFSPSNIVDASIGYFSYYLAKIGGFNYISREIGETRPYKSFYTTSQTSGFNECMEDLNRLACHKGDWIFTMLAASGANEPEYPTQLHFGFGGNQGDEELNSSHLFIQDKEDALKLFNEISLKVEEEFGISCDCQKYHQTSSEKLFMRHLNNPNLINNCVIRAAWSCILWNMRRVKLAKCLAELLASHICPEAPVGNDPELKIKNIGYSDYNN